MNKIELSPEYVDRIFTEYKPDIGSIDFPPILPPVDFGYGGEDDRDPERARRVTGILRFMIGALRRPFCMLPEDAPLHMSEHFGMAEKRNEHKPQFPTGKIL